MKAMKGQTPGWWAVAGTGAPLSGPWLSPIDARIRGRRHPNVVAAVQWTGAAVSHEFPVAPQEAAA